MLLVAMMVDQFTMTKKKIHSDFHQMNLSSHSKKRRKTVKWLNVRKISNSEYGRRIDQREKAVCVKYVKPILNLHNWPSTQKFKAKLRLQRQQVLRFPLKDQRIERTVGSSSRKSVRCFWCNKCWRQNKKKLRG